MIVGLAKLMFVLILIKIIIVMRDLDRYHKYKRLVITYEYGGIILTYNTRYYALDDDDLEFVNGRIRSLRWTLAMDTLFEILYLYFILK